MKSFLKLCLAFLLFLFSMSCQTAQETSSENSKNVAVQPTQAKSDSLKSETISAIEVPKLANKSVGELDKIFGKPKESKPIENGGEYRLYKIANQPKGLAVRFYGGRAKSFNLILEKPLPTSKDALKQTFGIDVGNAAPTKDKNEPLTEIWKGTFGGVKFSKVSAKKQDGGNGFIFVLADVE